MPAGEKLCAVCENPCATLDFKPLLDIRRNPLTLKYFPPENSSAFCVFITSNEPFSE
jgi:hypothetical protein